MKSKGLEQLPTCTSCGASVSEKDLTGNWGLCDKCFVMNVESYTTTFVDVDEDKDEMMVPVPCDPTMLAGNFGGGLPWSSR